ncbi:MAG: TIGR04282 family arsenosugar biosynthesis glycosyltransferase [Marinobacter sp.]|nr:TIGR04282 family arsenosugar biosynthesis glycosyltransferase [Marinobacter sp.]
MKPVRIIIIAKEPRPGLAKTRLIPALGAEGAAGLADRLLRYTLQQALAADTGPVELCVAPDMHAPFWPSLVGKAPVTLTQQEAGDLGTRMATAAQQGLGQGTPVMLIGTDCPALDVGRLRTMARLLADHDACLCPVRDGGYSLLGLQRLDGSLFQDMPWSTDRVAALTRQRLDRLGWSWQESELLADVDEPTDLSHLEQHYPQLAGSDS